MSTESERVDPSPPPSPSASPRYPITNDSNPVWLPDGPFGLQDNHEDLKKDIWTTEREGKHWNKCRDMLKSHDTRVLTDWVDEINTQLLVSSLLAAVAGGFVVESQKTLSEDPAVTSAVILFQIARQLNQSIGLPSTELMVFAGPSTVERAYNSLFYASLGLSLANVTLGLMCLQWIRGIRHDPPGVSSPGYTLLRYVRYRGFELWGAKGIISALPLLLLVSLLAFFAGLLAFASNSDWMASIPLYIILTSVFAVVLFTTFVPGLVIVLNSAFRKGSQFPSVPPFRSLQSWIVMQGFIRIFQAINRVYKLNPFGAFPSVRKCLDWGQLDLLWTRWAVKKPEDCLLFPVILSAGINMEKMNTISTILELDFGQDSNPKFRKLTVLEHLASFGQRLPATTLGDISTLFIGEMVALINVGTSLSTLSSDFESEKQVALDFVPTETMLQLVNSLSFLCRTEKPSIKGFWNLFWRALGDSIQGVPYMHDPKTAPVLFKDALDSMQIVLDEPPTDIQTIFRRGFKSFITTLAYEVDHERAWARSETGSATLCTIVSHPIWTPARKIIAALPPGDHATAAHKCLRTLDRIRQKISRMIVEPSPPRDGSVLEELHSKREDNWATISPHIAVDIGHEDLDSDDDDDDVTSAVAASADAVGGVTELKEDEGGGGMEEEIATDQEQPITDVVFALFALPTPLIDSPTSPSDPSGML